MPDGHRTEIRTWSNQLASATPTHSPTITVSADEWIGDVRRLFQMTVERAFELGPITNRLRMGSVNGADAVEGA